MCVVVICATYQDNLVATLTVKKVSWPFTDIYGLVKSEDYSFLLQTGTYREDLLKVHGQCHTIHNRGNDRLINIKYEIIMVGMLEGGST